MGRTGMAAWLRDWPGGRANSVATARDSGQPGRPKGRQVAGQGFEPGAPTGTRLPAMEEAHSLDGPRRGRCGTPPGVRGRGAVREWGAADPQEAGSGAGWATEGSAGGGSSSDR